MKATRGERNNNPGNIRPASYTWQGQIGIDSGPMGSYLIFERPEDGIRAIAKDLMTKYARGLNTVHAIINRWAPPSENDTNAYVKAVANEVGVQPDDKIDLNDASTLTKLVTAIIRHENGRVIYAESMIGGVTEALV